MVLTSSLGIVCSKRIFFLFAHVRAATLSFSQKKKMRKKTETTWTRDGGRRVESRIEWSGDERSSVMFICIYIVREREHKRKQTHSAEINKHF